MNRIEKRLFEVAKANTDISVSSDALIERAWWSEKLIHSVDAVDLSRSEPNGLPILINHDPSMLAGRIPLRVEGNQCRGVPEFDVLDPEIKKWVDKIERGVAMDWSISYKIDDYEIEKSSDDEKPDILKATRWTPLEVSLVSVAADPSVGYNRSLLSSDENQQMDKDENSIVKLTQSEADAFRLEGARLETERRNLIDNLFQGYVDRGPEYKSLLTKLQHEGRSYDEAREALLALERSKTPTATPVSTPTVERAEQQVTAGLDRGEKAYEAMVSGLGFRMKPILSKDEKKEAGENPYAFLSLGELAREFVREVTGSRQALSINKAVMLAMDPGRNLRLPVSQRDLLSHATGDFTNILANVAEKEIVISYQGAETTWRAIARVGRLSNFQQADRPSVSAFPSLTTVAEGDEYEHGSMSDLKEQIQLETYGKKYAITRQAIINDELDSAISNPATAMGRAAARTVNQKVWAVITSNPTLNQDSTALYDSGHANIGTAGSPSVTTLSEARRLMRVQRDPSSNEILRLSPKILALPPIWETEGKVLVSAEALDYEVVTATAGEEQMNARRGANQFSNLVPIIEPELGGTAGTDNDWFVFESPDIFPTVEAAFLDGETDPYIASREGWNIDGVEWKVRLDMDAKALSYQGTVKNAGS